MLCFCLCLDTISHYAGKRLFGPHKKILHLIIHILFLFDNLYGVRENADLVSNNEWV